MSRRHEFSNRVKGEAWARSGGRCEGCGAILKRKDADFDHDNPAAFGGRGVLENCRVLCRAVCHPAKTYGRDIPAVAKSNRIRAREAGIKRRSKFQTSRDGPYKAKIGGGVVKR